MWLPSLPKAVSNPCNAPFEVIQTVHAQAGYPGLLHFMLPVSCLGLVHRTSCTRQARHNC